MAAVEPRFEPADEDLDAALLGPEPDFDAPSHCEDLDEANRWVRAIHHLDDDLVRIQAAAQRERARIDAWEQRHTDRIQGRRRWYAQAVEALHDALLREDPRRLTIHLPAGTLRAAGQQPEWQYIDEAAAVAWLEAHHPELVRQPDPPAPRPDKAGVKKALTPAPGKPGDAVAAIDPDTGEAVPGLMVVRRGRKHWIDITPEPEEAPEP